MTCVPHDIARTHPGTTLWATYSHVSCTRNSTTWPLRVPIRSQAGAAACGCHARHVHCRAMSSSSRRRGMSTSPRHVGPAYKRTLRRVSIVANRQLRAALDGDHAAAYHAGPPSTMLGTTEAVGSSWTGSGAYAPAHSLSRGASRTSCSRAAPTRGVRMCRASFVATTTWPSSDHCTHALGAHARPVASVCDATILGIRSERGWRVAPHAPGPFSMHTTHPTRCPCRAGPCPTRHRRGRGTPGFP